jgi:hypothetical protein
VRHEHWNNIEQRTHSLLQLQAQLVPWEVR